MTVQEFLQNYGGNEVKDREIKEWNIIGGGMYKVELWIDLEE